MGKRPSHDLFLVNKDTKVYTKVGVGWVNTSGSISVTLDPGTVLDWRMAQEFYINVLPTKSRAQRSSPPKKDSYNSATVPTEDGQVDWSEDIPF